jgi:hypothetical protein
MVLGPPGTGTPPGAVAGALTACQRGLSRAGTPREAVVQPLQPAAPRHPLQPKRKPSLNAAWCVLAAGGVITTMMAPGRGRGLDTMARAARYTVHLTTNTHLSRAGGLFSRRLPDVTPCPASW